MLSLYAIDHFNPRLHELLPTVHGCEHRCRSACRKGQKRTLAQACARDMVTELIERQEAYELVAEVPGLSKEDLEVEVEGNVIRIRQKLPQTTAAPAAVSSDAAAAPAADPAASKDNAQPNTAAPLPDTSPRRRRFRSSVVTLPDDADVSKTTAMCEAGVLKLVVPKKPPAKPRAARSVPVV